MGLVIGTIIVYQILYTDMTEYLPEYTILKAMGCIDFYLFKVFFQEVIKSF